MPTYRCPDSVRCPDDVVGCGAVFEAEPDHEGLVDCPECGIWFNPKTEPETVVAGVPASRNDQQENGYEPS